MQKRHPLKPPHLPELKFLSVRCSHKTHYSQYALMILAESHVSGYDFSEMPPLQLPELLPEFQDTLDFPFFLCRQPEDCHIFFSQDKSVFQNLCLFRISFCCCLFCHFFKFLSCFLFCLIFNMLDLPAERKRLCIGRIEAKKYRCICSGIALNRKRFVCFCIPKHFQDIRPRGRHLFCLFKKYF